MYLKIAFLTHDTTSWLDGLEGLSRLITPELMYDFRSRLSGVLPFGMGVKCPVRTSTTHCDCIRMIWLSPSDQYFENASKKHISKIVRSGATDKKR